MSAIRPEASDRSAIRPGSAAAADPVEREAELIERFVDCYRRQFDTLIERLNADPQAAGDPKSFRMCVEAVNMMLSTHGRMAKALRESIASRTRPVARAARGVTGDVGREDVVRRLGGQGQ